MTIKMKKSVMENLSGKTYIGKRSITEDRTQ